MSNWKKLQAELGGTCLRKGKGKRREKKDTSKRRRILEWGSELGIKRADLIKAYGDLEEKGENLKVAKYLALDCEFVGVGLKDSALARVSLVNYHGMLIYDAIVKPKEAVTDWRTPVSGIHEDMMVDAKAFEQVQQEVANIIEKKVLVGHALHHDLKALLLSHPRRMTIDTSLHPPFRRLAGGRSPGLARLAKTYLDLDIQTGQHSSIEDAQATMLLYRKFRSDFTP
jgi:RNA exonuclease 4